MRRTIGIGLFAVMVLAGLWWQARTSRVSEANTVPFERMMQDLRAADVVFIGETHSEPLHHQLEERIIRSLHESGVSIVIGLEMFRSDDQRSLDAWVDGDMSEERFIRRYHDNWNLPWPLYRGIFLYAREHRIPLVGLNIPQEITSAVARNGFASLTPDQRASVPAGIACNVGPRYREFIRQAYAGHAPRANRSFERFCEAQLLWDEAMAHRIAGYRTQHPAPMVVLAGLGHAWRRGIPEQLEKYAKLSVRVVLPALPGGRSPRAAISRDADYIVMQ